MIFYVGNKKGGVVLGKEEGIGFYFVLYGVVCIRLVVEGV